MVRKKKRDRSKRPERRAATRILRRYLIVSEDAKSSIDYFESFPHNPKLVKIVTEGGAGNTRSVVEEGIAMQQEAKKAKQPYVHVYCVFDRDDHPEERYRAAFDLAHSRNDITAIWANECYELWLMLHYKYHHTGIGRNDIYSYLNEHFDDNYEKSNDESYKKTKDLISIALSNADKILAHAEEENPGQPWISNPSTNIQNLVRKLIELSELRT